MPDDVTALQAELSDRLVRIDGKIAAVQAELDILNDPLREIEFEERLAKLRDDRAGIIDHLEALPAIQLQDALLRLDYTDQVTRFRDVVGQHHAVAFLVTPSSDVADAAIDASLLLLKRLLRMLPHAGGAAPIRMGFASPVRQSTVEAVWRELARAVGLPRDATPDEVAGAVAARLQNQNVVVVVQDLDRVDVAACLSGVWEVLVDAAEAAAPERHLVLFLVDVSASAPAVDEGDHVLLLRVSPFPRAEIAKWFEVHLDVLPHGVGPPFDDLAGSIVDATGGRPDEVLWRISDLWNCPGWELDTWLKL